MKTKILLWSVVSIFIVILAVGLYWWWSRPQVFTFNDGSKLTLVGVDYGRRNHVPRGGPPPATAGGSPSRGVVPRSFTTPNDTLVVWARAKYDSNPTSPNPYYNFQLAVYDKAGTACALAFGSTMSGNRQANDMLMFQFQAFPRREGKLYFRALENGSGGQEMSENKLAVSNPARGKSHPKWTPDPVPDTQSDGDLAVTLTKLVAGVAMRYQRDRDNADDAMNKGIQVSYRVERDGKPVRNWTPMSLETTDATGNRTLISYGANGGNQVQWKGDEGTLTCPNGLWPDEPAWKLRVQMTQTADFSSDEQWTAQNVPVVPGSQETFNGMAGVRGRVVVRNGVVTQLPNPSGDNAPPPTPCAEADLGGHHIKIFPAVQFTNLPARPPNLPANAVFTQPQQTGLMIQIQPAVVNYVGRMNGTQPPGDAMSVTLAKVTDGQGGEIQTYSSGWSSTGAGGADSISTYRFTLRDIGSVTNITATIALHKDRFFEFTVKPEKATSAEP
ncbi:MAG TPA: hypothetical protein VFY06_05160 [Verrucomicrobiae bacterium]|nr:hypothetical protein [Verrucomicrobiae bacterium]